MIDELRINIINLSTSYFEPQNVKVKKLLNFVIRHSIFIPAVAGNLFLYNIFAQNTRITSKVSYKKIFPRFHPAIITFIVTGHHQVYELTPPGM